MAAACVGQPSCALTASFRVFGDPCAEHVKSLAVVASGCNGTTRFAHPAAATTAVFTYDARVPVGATAEVHLPTMGHPSTSVDVFESGAKVWAHGGFVAGAAAGLVSVEVEVGAGGGDELVAVVGSGSYAFEVHAAA